MVVMKPKRLYKVVFLNAGKVWEIYASGVSQGELYGFVEVSGIVFGERSAVVVDPAEERLKTEFEGVRRSFIPLHAVVRIDEVEKQGTARIRSAEDGKIAHFPTPFQPPMKE